MAKSIKEMNLLKAPGPDGFYAGFYSIQSVTGPTITTFVKRAMRGEDLNEGITEALLIPKVEHLSNITQFRPIICAT